MDHAVIMTMFFWNRGSFLRHAFRAFKDNEQRVMIAIVNDSIPSHALWMSAKVQRYILI